MLKLLWKLYQNAHCLRLDLPRAKYLGDNDIFAPSVPKKGSQFWIALRKLKWYFKPGAKHQVWSGGRTYFWLDWWSGRSLVRERYPNLFGCCALPFLTVHSARDGEGWRIRFRRKFGMAEMVEWDNLTWEIEGYAPSEEVDGVS
jgi:hypothetical protein